MQTKVLHVLDHSLPEQSGYASRSHSILRSLRDLEVNVEALTGPKHRADSDTEEVIDSIRYRRTLIRSGARTDGVSGQLRTIFATRKAVRRVGADEEISVLHAHSPCLNGLAALNLGIPLLYEMRSSWEDASVSSGITTEGSMRYRVSRLLETSVARRADAVVVICEGLRDELIGRGIPQDRITVVPNAVPEALLESADAETIGTLKEKFGLANCRVIGFFGSFFEWEGVELLIRAMPGILAAMSDVRLLLAGGGRQEASLRKLVSDMELEEAVIFAGRVPAAEIPGLYGVADVMAFPRHSDRLTEMVTPLKPLEAMAQRVAVVASDVGGHRELIRDGETGFLHRAGDEQDLSAKILAALSEKDTVDRMIAAARNFVENERRWSVVSRRYLPVYEKLAAAAAARGTAPRFRA